MKSLLRRLYRSSVWHPDNLDLGAYAYRNLERVWLPVFDLICMLIGYLAMAYSSRLLDSLYPDGLIDTMGAVFLVFSGIAMVAVCFPRLLPLEIIAKLVMVGLLGAYSATLWVSFFTGELQGGMVAALLMLPILFPLFRLQMLGERRKARLSGRA